MGAPDSGILAADQGAAESLLSSFKSIDPSERRKHATVLNYWLSIRGDREFPPLHDLDPLELSDAGPNSILLELISGGHDAEIRHVGDALKAEVTAERLIDAPSPSLLSLISKKLPIVALSRDFLAFEDHYSTAEGVSRYWVTLLPLSACGNWVDYVYAMVSFKAPNRAAEEAPLSEADPEEAIPAEQAEPTAAAVDAPAEEIVADEVEEPVELVADGEVEAEEIVSAEAEAEVEAVLDEPQQAVDAITHNADPEAAEEAPVEPEPGGDAPSGPGFSRLFDTLAGLAGFYGQGVKVEPHLSAPSAEGQSADFEATSEEESPSEDEFTVEEAPTDEIQPPAEPVAEEAALADMEPAVEDEPAAEEPTADIPADEEQAELATPAMEASLQSKLADVRAKADEARQAKLRANAALYEGLSAAYDFALDAEDSPEEYLRLVEAQGLKIQLRSPMKPVVKLAFDGMCDDATVKQLEAVLAWAFAEELPRGSLAERIEAAGGIAYVLNGEAKPS